MRLWKHGWRIKGSYRNFDKAEKKSKKWTVGNLQINSNSPCGYFDSAANKNSNTCGAGSSPVISDKHEIHFECGLGQGTNNFAEINANTI